MQPYHTFKNISHSKYEEIKKFIQSKYKIKVLPKKSPGLEEYFDILYESIKVHYYTNGKLLFQSSPTNKIYAKLVFDIDKKFSLNTINEIDKIEQKTISIPSDVKYYVGCDESGTGETFGSIFLACVLVEAKNLKSIKQLFDIPDIKELSPGELIDKYAKIEKYCKIFVNKCEPSEIDETNKNILLDQKYVELLKDAISGKEKLCVIIDDYGIQRELKTFLDKLRANSNTVIAEIHADEKYPACQAASVIARKERFENVRNFNKDAGVPNEFGKMIYPGAGNANNPQTADYLEAFVKQNPGKEIPPFVRRKWSNVKKLLGQISNQKITGFFGD